MVIKNEDGSAREGACPVDPEIMCGLPQLPVVSVPQECEI
jgi:hypothetical protein